ncbi:hypothetical protein PTSG_07889 [Salpingoeca rosetta]|uniref:Uncharacterized protein n=1 Tax=Salpingoeca rosetta (strain ATCC 50818 / BSB-021) TaxID=946362 RepID=F2UGM0_SALR5|nr:uncharacterized protein PTSG_07889 [Salpingoeca rosetta]EGD75770.1 hypothetical protein PTSG_07889 [Salpingoeca rosetta]|eukprot:XP_004991691.1 hypothetical protein PTSG_07889 [Salpingoeca rosetta]
MSEDAAGDNLPALFAKAMSCWQDVRAGKDPQKRLDEGLASVKRAAHFLLHLNVFSDNEEHTEHSTLSLRYLAIPFIHAELLSRKFPAERDPEVRDKERITYVVRARELYQQFIRNLRDMEFPFAAPKVVDYYLEAKPGNRRERDTKIAHLKAMKAAESTLQEIEEVVKSKDLDEDDEMHREHMMALLHSYLLKACDQVENVGVELSMLEHVVRMRAAGEHPPSSQQLRDEAKQRKPEPPLVLTSDAVKSMAASGKTINRANFKLLTRGYGPIGAPTMTMEEVAQIEMQQAMEAQRRQQQEEAQAQEVDPDSEEASVAETYKLRAQDEWNDDHRRGEGNRYNMG